MKEEKLDDIKTLKANRGEVHIPDKKQENLRKEVKKILERREKEEAWDFMKEHLDAYAAEYMKKLVEDKVINEKGITK